jgi:hypothetical protein
MPSESLVYPYNEEKLDLSALCNSPFFSNTLIAFLRLLFYHL